MPETVTHPTPQALAAFAKGQLAQAAAASVSRHLERCSACRQAVARLAPGRGTTQVGGAVSPATPAPAAPPLSLPPELANHPKYRIVRELGRGGMGVVYQAVQTLMDRPVAIKVINPSVLQYGEALPRFQAEVKAAAKLDHPNIVRAYDADQVGPLHLLVMEFVEGMNLADVVQQKGALPVAHACHYIRQAALGLQHAFEQGMTHRDIKPQNLMLAPRGVVKILDFGLARLRTGQVRDTGLTASGSFMGTPDYVAPEQATDARTADTRSDLYSLGGTLYHLLAGRPPFQEETTVKLVLAHLEKEPAPLHTLRPDVPAALSAVVSRLLAKDPTQRYQTPVEVAQALVPFIKAGAATAAPVTVEGVASPGRATVTGGETSRPKNLNPKTAPAKAGNAVPITAMAVPASHPHAASAPEKIVTLNRPPASTAARRWPIFAGIGGTVVALALVGWLLAAVVFKPRTALTDTPTVLMLQVDQSDAEVFLDGQPITFHAPAPNESVPIEVQPGPHKVRISKAAFVTFTREIEVKAGDSIPLQVRLQPAAPVQVAKQAQVLPKLPVPVLDLRDKGSNPPSGPSGPVQQPGPPPDVAPPPPPQTEVKPPPMPGGTPAAPAKVDPLRQDIERLQTTFNHRIKRADDQLLAAFRRETGRVKMQHLKGDRQLKAIEALDREKAAFEQERTLPWSPRMRQAALNYLEELRTAARPLRRAYKAAIEHYTRTGPLSTAQQYDAELHSALAPRVAGTWDCNGVTFRRHWRWTLYIDGTANERNGQVTWKLDHHHLVIMSKNSAAPGGTWIDTCTIGRFGQGFNAMNQKKARYNGKLVN